MHYIVHMATQRKTKPKSIAKGVRLQPDVAAGLRPLARRGWSRPINELLREALAARQAKREAA